MQFSRRELFRTIGLTGAGLGISRLSGSAAAQSITTPTNSEFVGPGAWPFQEIRIPFHERKAKVKWPNETRLAVRVYITAEWRTHKAPEGAFYKTDLYSTSGDGQYAFTAAIHRAVELVEKYSIKTSIFPHGSVIAAYPDLHRELHRLGHEITARSIGTGTSPISMLRPEQEEAQIRQVTETIANIIGERPVGWISPGAKSTNKTPEILANLGYLWYGDLNGDDLPYGLQFGDKILVAIPHRQGSTNDIYVFDSLFREVTTSSRDPQTAFDYFRHTFDAYYETADIEAPTMMMYGIHPQFSCWPDRIRFHDKALRYMKGFKEVWFARHKDIAQWWKDHYI